MNENSNQNQAINQILKDLQDQSNKKERPQQKYGNFDAIKKLMEEKWEEKKQKRYYGF